MNSRIGNDMVIIQHQREVRDLSIYQLVGEDGEDTLQWRSLCYLKQMQHRHTQMWQRSLQSSQQIGEKTDRIVVFRDER